MKPPPGEKRRASYVNNKNKSLTSSRRETINPCKSLELVDDYDDTSTPSSSSSSGAKKEKYRTVDRRNQHSRVLSTAATKTTRQRTRWVFFINALLYLTISIVVLIQHAVDDAKTPNRWHLSVLLLVALVLCLIPGCIILRVQAVEIAARQLIRPDTGTLLIIGAFYSILLQLTIRLGVAKDSFGGHGFANLDFGVKCTFLNETVTNTCQNYAFTDDPETWGHFFQGCLSVLLYPATQIIIHQRCRCKGKAGVQDALIVSSETAAVGVVAYPIYNLAKRMSSKIPFAASSFSNNAAEWAWGFLIGHHTGWCLEVFSAYFGLFHEWYSERTDPTLMNEEERRIRNAVLFFLQKARIVAGISLCIVSIVAAVMYGQSWDAKLNRVTNSSISSTDDEDVTASFVLLLVPILISCMIGGIWYVCHLRRLTLAKKGEDITVGERNLFKRPSLSKESGVFKNNLDVDIVAAENGITLHEREVDAEMAVSPSVD